jgi:hypothetical protein
MEKYNEKDFELTEDEMKKCDAVFDAISDGKEYIGRK